MKSDFISQYMLENYWIAFKSGSTLIRGKIILGFLLVLNGIWGIGQTIFGLVFMYNPSRSGSSLVGYVAAAVLSLTLNSASLFVGRWLLRSTGGETRSETTTDGSADPIKKSKFALLYPWFLVFLPLPFIFILPSVSESARHNDTAGYLFMYYLLYVTITMPLAVISSANSTKWIYVTCNLLISLPVLYILLILGADSFK